jgi:ABC-type transport system involved in cytochrome bd biosynthesis fused ATPase/permease subunit
LVTQRLSTLVESDMIIFLDKGEIVDIGTHYELIERSPKYQFMLSHLPTDEVLARMNQSQENNKNGGNQ